MYEVSNISKPNLKNSRASEAIDVTNVRVVVNYLHGVLQGGVLVVWRVQALQQTGVKVVTLADHPPRHVQLLFQHFIQS